MAMELARLSAISSANTSTNPRQSLEKAVSDFQAILTDDERANLAMIGDVRSPDTVLGFAAQLDCKNQLNKGRGVASRLHRFLKSSLEFTAVVDTYVSARPEIAALVWGSIKLALLIAVKVTSYFESLSEILMIIGKQCPRFSEYQALWPSSTRLQEAICDFHASVIRCCKHVVEIIKAGMTWKRVWKSFDQELKPDMDEIDTLGRHVNAEIGLAQAMAIVHEQQLQEVERAVASKQRSIFKKFVSKTGKDLATIEDQQLKQAERLSSTSHFSYS